MKGKSKIENLGSRDDGRSLISKVIRIVFEDCYRALDSSVLMWNRLRSHYQVLMVNGFELMKREVSKWVERLMFASDINELGKNSKSFELHPCIFKELIVYTQLRNGDKNKEE